jgi:uncharacterized protein YbjT (DUF2867 family)
MQLILMGATGMVGAGALREALADDDVEGILAVVRRPLEEKHAKLSELIVPDLFDAAPYESELTGYDACIWAIGVTSVGIGEQEYAKVTEELTLLWARALLRLNPGLSFCYVSGQGAGGSTMWARVRQRVERALEAMPFRHAGVVRPGFIRPGPGITSRTRVYRIAIAIFRPLFPIVERLFPSSLTTSERLGRAMLRVVKGEADRFILEMPDINALGR